MSHKNIVKIEFPLSFYIPIEEGLQGLSSYQGFAAFKFKFITYKNESIKSIAELEELCTTILIEYIPLYDTSKLSSEDILRHAVLNCITHLNNFLDSFRLLTNLNYIKNFNITDLPPIIYIELNGDNIAYMTTPTTLLNNPSPLNSKKIQAIQNRIEAWNRNPYFEVIDKFLSKAIHHLYTEEPIFAIVEMQTSFEVYIRLCHNLILTKDNASIEKINAAKKYALKNTIIDHIGRKLDVDLNFNTNPIVNQWYTKLYSIRNNIVHSGLSYISGNQSYEAFDALEQIIGYINKLMVTKEYMEKGGEVIIKPFDKNTSDYVSREEVIENLKNKGFL